MTTKRAWFAIALFSALGLFVQCNTRTPVGALADGGSPGAGGSGGGKAGMTGFAGGTADTTGFAGANAGTTGFAGGTAGVGAVPCPTPPSASNVFLAAKALDYPKTALATALAVADVNGDGAADILVGGQDVPPPTVPGAAGGNGAGGAGGNSAASVTVFLADKANGFAPAVPYAGPVGFYVGVADLDGDKRPDLVSASPRGPTIRLNKGAGAFGDPTSYDVPSLVGFTTTDLNGDGKAEMLFPTVDDQGGLVVLMSAGGSSYTATTYDAGFAPSAVAAGQIVGGAYPDAVTVGPKGVHVFFNGGGGSGNLTGPTSFANTGSSVALVDVDGDSKLDVVVNGGLGYEGGAISVFLNLGDGHLAVARQLPLYGNALFGDVDGDGKADAVVLNSDCSTLTLSLNDGHGSFSAPSYIGSTPADAYVLFALGDVNGDKALDLVTATAGGVSVRLHRAP